MIQVASFSKDVAKGVEEVCQAFNEVGVHKFLAMLVQGSIYVEQQVVLNAWANND